MDDGSSDGTPDLVRAFGLTTNHITLLERSHKGKGYAVKTGILAANGIVRFQCDADLSMPIDQIDRFLSSNLQKFQIVTFREARLIIVSDGPLFRWQFGIFDKTYSA